jgi:hypothetical protein
MPHESIVSTVALWLVFAAISIFFTAKDYIWEVQFEQQLETVD